jgi:hypothetical protein
MLGLPVGGWLRFFGGGLAAGALLLLLVPVPPIAFLALFVMAAAGAGLVVVGVYARLYAPYAWLRLGVRFRRLRRVWRRQRELARLRARVIHDRWTAQRLARNREGTTPP